jgi:hypothetical protein
MGNPARPHVPRSSSPFRRFPAQCPITYNAGPFLGKAWSGTSRVQVKNYLVIFPCGHKNLPAQAAVEIAKMAGKKSTQHVKQAEKNEDCLYDPQIFSGRCRPRYYDPYVIHGEDVDVNVRLGSDEVSFFSGVRRC